MCNKYPLCVAGKPSCIQAGHILRRPLAHILVLGALAVPCQHVHGLRLLGGELQSLGHAHALMKKAVCGGGHCDHDDVLGPLEPTPHAQ